MYILYSAPLLLRVALIQGVIACPSWTFHMVWTGVCVQVCLQLHTQVVRTKKTALARGSEPTFNEKLTFKLLPPQLDDASLCLEVLRSSAVGPGECQSKNGHHSKHNHNNRPCEMH